MALLTEPTAGVLWAWYFQQLLSEILKPHSFPLYFCASWELLMSCYLFCNGCYASFHTSSTEEAAEVRGGPTPQSCHTINCFTDWPPALQLATVRGGLLSPIPILLPKDHVVQERISDRWQKPACVNPTPAPGARSIRYDQWGLQSLLTWKSHFNFLFFVIFFFFFNTKNPFPQTKR